MRVILLFLLLVAPLPARWWQASFGRFRIISDSNERSVRENLARLETASRVFAQLFPRTSTPMPVEMFYLSASRFRAVRPGDANSGFYQSAPDRDYIAIAAGPSTRVIYHELTHLALHHSTGPLPQWLEEGLAEFHSTLESTATRVRLGVPVREHLMALASRPWLGAAELSRVGKHSPQYNEVSRKTVFYAQSWALVHMLRLAPRYRPRFPEFLRAVAAGEPQSEAFRRFFDQSLDDAIVELKAYLGQHSLPVIEFDAVGEGSSPAAANIAVLSDLDGDLAYAELAIQSGHPEAGESVYRKLAASHPSDARSLEILGLHALERHNQAEALTVLRRAIQLRDARPLAFFEYAMLVRDGGGDRAEVKRNLEEAVRRNPNFAEAHFLLATFAANENRHADAIPHLERATAILPRQPSFWHALAISYHALGRQSEARTAARRALETASTATQAEMARAVIRLTDSQASTPASGPGVIVPESWNGPQGNMRIEGVLDRIDCIGRSARFHVRAKAGLMAFWVENPGEVLLKNLTSMTFEFHCGVQKPVPITVDFLAQPDAANMTAGVVTALEFR